MLLEMMFDVVFCLIYLVMNTRLWFVFLPLPLSEIIFSIFLLWSAFYRALPKYLLTKLSLTTISVSAASFFQAYHLQLVNP